MVASSDPGIADLFVSTLAPDVRIMWVAAASAESGNLGGITGHT